MRVRRGACINKRFMSKRLLAYSLIALAAAAVIVSACRKDGNRRYRRPSVISFTIPPGFPQPVYDFNANPVTREGFELGRKLFHDSRLSLGVDVTCGSCHQQHAAYTTFDHDLGHGTNHQHTTRNVPGIFNMAWHSSFGWDGRLGTLEAQVMACLEAPEKMGGQLQDIIAYTSDDPQYKQMFGEAFGNDVSDSARIGDALTQFVLMLVSADSRYDRWKKGNLAFNSSEQNGYSLFIEKCASCHGEPLFTDLSYRHNGLWLNTFNPDNGRMLVTGNPADSLKFKVPSLRNVALTSHYVHDGRFGAISQMLDHYSEGISAGPTLDPSLADGIPLTDLEKFYLTEFLFTLNDSTLISNEDFEAP